MFDRVVLMPSRSSSQHHYHRTEHHEHRAPTDESVKLLREMEQAAEAKRVAAMQMPGNDFHGLVEVNHSMSDGCLIAKALFDINGKRMTAEARIFHDEAPADLLVKLRDEVAKVVGTEILCGMTRGLGNHIGLNRVVA